jgi:DNA-binding MarR family transcriptional regulator
MDEPLNFDVGQHGELQFLATRSKGREMRGELEDRISRGRPDEVVIDFTSVEAMTISFADEFVGRFYTSVASGDIVASLVLLTGLNEENLATVSICLERRELAAAAIINNQPELVGAPDYLAETYKQAVSLGTFSAVDLADQLGISAQNMNNRLKRLVEAGAVRRRRITSGRGGKEFLYTAPAPCGIPW